MEETKSKIVNFCTMWQAVYKSTEGEINSGEIKTIPDMSLSVKDIIERYRRGTISLDELQRDMYDTDDDIDDDSLDSIDDISDVYYQTKFNHDTINRAVNSLESQTKEVFNKSDSTEFEPNVVEP